MTDMWHLVHNQGIVRDDYIVIKVESEWLLCYTTPPLRRQSPLALLKINERYKDHIGLEGVVAV